MADRRTPPRRHPVPWTSLFEASLKRQRTILTFGVVTLLGGLLRRFDTLLTAESLEWIAGYESWIARTCGAVYMQALAGWKPRACSAALMSDSWSDLAEEVAGSHGMELHRPACGLRPGFATAH